MIFVGIIALVFILTSPVSAKSSDFNFDYSVKTEFIYADVLDPTHTSLAITQDPSSGVQEGSRTLGLTHLSLDLEFSHKNSYLLLGLRPDATLYRKDEFEENYDYDSRSGSSYRLPARIELLDTYELGLIKTNSFKISYGVKNSSYRNKSAYEAPLEFGLDVWFPRKFSSLQITWEAKNITKAAIDLNKPSKFRAVLFSLETDGDRHEIYSNKSKTDDYAPSSIDPHTGLGAQIRYNPSLDQTFSLFGAYLDSKVDFGRKSRLMAAFNWFDSFSIFNHRLTLSYDARYSREHWKVTSGVYPQLEQYSQSFKSRYWLSSTSSVFSGLSKGVSQRPLSENSIDKSIHTGLQIDIGYQHSLHESLLLSIHATNEKREVDQNGNLSGGFSIDGTAKDQLNRIAMKLTYQIL